MKPPATLSHLFVPALLATTLLCSCEALTNAALRVGSNLLASAASNYNPSYGDEVRSLLQGLREELKPGTPTLAAGTPAPEPQPQVEAAGTPTPEPVPVPAQAETGLSLEVALLRQREVDGMIESEPIEDGEVLVDADTNGQSDRFKIFVRSDQECYVYVILVDGTGWVQPLFFGEPQSQGNPLGEGSEMFLPEGELAYALDSYKGVETIYFVASRRPRPQLEAALQRFAAKQRRPPQSAVPVDNPEFLERGLARRSSGKPGQLRTRAGVQPVSTTRFLSELGKDSLVVTRWFRHQ